MDIDTETIRRLRDMLLEAGPASLPTGVALPPDAATPEQQAIIDRISPIVETMFLMMVSDENVADAERDSIRGAIRTLTDGALGTALIAAMLDRFEAALRDEGRDARLHRVTTALAASRDDADAAYALAAAVALADGQVDPSETGLLGEIGEWLGISGSRARKILNRD